MICAASGIFEHYFGDPSTGNLATAKTMELPMVKKFVILQTIWRDVYLKLLNYVIDRKIEAGVLPGRVELDPKNKRKKYITDLDRTIDIDFPPILEEDLAVWATALQTASSTGLISEETAAKLFIQAANINDVDSELDLIAGDKARKQAQDVANSLAVDPNDAGGTPSVPAKGKPSQTKPSTPSADPTPPIDTPLIRESAVSTKSRLDLRHAKKTNYTMQRMNGYRKVLNGHLKDLLDSTRKSIKIYKHGDKYVAHSADFGNNLHKFTHKMQESAKQYFPIAIQIGSKHIQSVLKDIKEGYEPTLSLFEANDKAKALLQDRLDWNASYLNDSLEPDMHTAFDAAVRETYDSEADAQDAVASAITKFSGRVEQYVGAFWTVEERAVKEAGSGSGVEVEFVGPDDKSTCQGCDDAVNGGPYPIEDAPVPGEQECFGMCRHALQVVDGSGDQTDNQGDA
jgi:hypothetical protein